jgi:hypothetical protein
MTLLRMRRWSRVVALAVALATVRLPHVGLDDAACAPSAEGSYAPHNETDHSIRSAGQQASDHCAICHFIRSARSSRPPVAASAAYCPILEQIPGDAVRFPSVAPHAEVPARAPPSTLL